MIVNVKICLGKRNVEYEIVIPEPDLHFRVDHDGGQLRDRHHLHALQGREPKGNDKKSIDVDLDHVDADSNTGSAHGSYWCVS